MEETHPQTTVQISGECGNRGPNKGPCGRSGYFWTARTAMTVLRDQRGCYINYG